MRFHLGFSGCISSTQAAAQSDEEPRVTAVGVAVAKSQKDSKWGGSEVMGMNAGTSVYLKIQLKGKTILSIDEAETPKIFGKDGEDLTGDSKKYRGSLRFRANYNPERDACTVPISGGKIPPTGSDKISVKGAITFVCGAAPKTETVEGDVKKDGKFKIANVDSKIQRLAKGFKENSSRISFRGSKSFDAVSEIYAVDKDGQEYKGSSAGSSSFGIGGKMTYDRSFQFECKQDQIAKFKVVYFSKLEKVKVPVDVSLGLGL